MYAIEVYPLISLLKDPKQYKQNWYADDSACAGSLLCIREWLLQLLRLGPTYGFFAEPSKSIIVVKEEHFQEAMGVFADLEVEVALVGRFLGSCIGKDEGIRQYVQGKVDLWVESVEHLAEVARAYLQRVIEGFTHSLSCEWSYLQRDIEGYDEEYFHLRDTIQHVFTPAVLGREVLEREH